MTLLLATATTSTDAQIRASGFDLKAAIIVSMLMFVEWPDSQSTLSDPILLCHLENNPLPKPLAVAKGEAYREQNPKSHESRP